MTHSLREHSCGELRFVFSGQRLEMLVIEIECVGLNRAAAPTGRSCAAANSREPELPRRDGTAWLTMQSAANQSPQQIPC
jgi:hypothetical protein